MGHLSLSLLGPFQAALDGQPITGFESNKVRALLAYLAVEAGCPHSRSTLAGLLWPNRPDRDALGNLRHALANLRQAINDYQAQPPFLFITRDTVQFNLASDYSLDLTDLQHLSGLPWRGSFLEGFSIGDSSIFEEWLLFKREQINRQMLEALGSLASVYEERGEYDQVIIYARRQLELEPWCEEAHQQLMRALVFSGQRSAALAQYEICRRLLAEELNVEPSPETIALDKRIREGQLSQFGPNMDFTPLNLSPGTATRQPSTVNDLSAALHAHSYNITAAPFVARERELGQLNRLLDLALAGQGRVVFITGHPGSGKTMLAHEFAQRAMRRYSDLIVAYGNGNAYTGLGDPYWPFIEIMRMLTGDIEARQSGGAISAEHASRLWNLLPLMAQTLVETGPDLLNRFVPGVALLRRGKVFVAADDITDETWLTRLNNLLKRNESALTGPVKGLQPDLFEQYTQVVRLIARQHPLLLVLDDLQWADAASLSLLSHLGRQLTGSRILMVGAYRPGNTAQSRPSIEAVAHEFQRKWDDLRLDLTQTEGHRFVEAFLDTEPNHLEPVFRETLYRHTNGHAMFTVELLRELEERSELVQNEGKWVEGPTLNWDKLPAQVEAVVAETMSRLPADWQALLTAASVEGEEFTAEVVARVLETEEGAVIRCLSGELTRWRRLVRAVSSQRCAEQQLSRYRFRHDLFQKYFYTRLDAVERVRLHRAVAQALESLCEDWQDAATAVTLAYHFEQGKVMDKAVDYILEAGQRDLQLLAFDEAAAHFKRGLALLETWPNIPERVQKKLALQAGQSLAMANAGV